MIAMTKNNKNEGIRMMEVTDTLLGQEEQNPDEGWEKEFNLLVVLKPCPFCGCEELDKNTTNPFAHWIECSNCGCQTKSGECWQEAVDNWNQRAKQDEIGEAIQQFTGFKIGKGGADILELASSMGLTKKEWEYIKKYEANGYLDEKDVKELDEYFKNNK